MPKKFDRQSMKERLKNKREKKDREFYDKGQKFLIDNEAKLLELGAKNITDIKETVRDFKKLQDEEANKKADKAMKELLAQEKKGKKGKVNENRTKVHLPTFKDGIFLTGNPKSKKNKKKIKKFKKGIKEAKENEEQVQDQKVLEEESEKMYLQEGGKVNGEFRKLLLGLSQAQGDQEKIDRALINHIKYFIEKDAKHITVKAKKKSWTQFLQGSTQSSVIYTLWKENILNNICHNTRRGPRDLKIHSYDCENIKLSNDPSIEPLLRDGLNTLFKKYIYINGKKETDWLNAETKQFIDSKNSVFHRAKDEIRAETDQTGGTKSKYNIKMARKFRRTRKKRGGGQLFSLVGARPSFNGDAIRPPTMDYFQNGPGSIDYYTNIAELIAILEGEPGIIDIAKEQKVPARLVAHVVILEAFFPEGDVRRPNSLSDKMIALNAIRNEKASAMQITVKNPEKYYKITKEMYEEANPELKGKPKKGGRKKRRKKKKRTKKKRRKRRKKTRRR